MKKIYLLILAVLLTQASIAQTMIRTVGSGGHYSTLSAAVNAINAGDLVGNIQLQITSDITETISAPIKINKTFTGLSEYNSIRIYPITPDVTITINAPTAIHAFVIEGSNVTVDGRLNESGDPNNLTFEFEGTPITGLSFANKARYNKVQYCNLYGKPTGYTEAIIAIGRSTDAHSDTALSNSFNAIKFNHIDADTPTSTSMVLGKVVIYPQNYADTIIGNHFTNTSFGISSPSGTIKAEIKLLGKNYGSIIQNNHFYETRGLKNVITNSTNNAYVYVSDTYSSNKFGYGLVLIDGNYFGGSSAYAEGAPTIIHGNPGGIHFQGIRSLATTNITNNTFKNFEFTNQGAVNASMTAILVEDKDNGPSHISNNIIGGPNLEDRITVSAINNSIAFKGIVIKRGKITVNNNSVQNVRLSNGHYASTTTFIGIHKEIMDEYFNDSECIIDNNFIGSTDPESMIYLNGGMTRTDYNFIHCGIYIEHGLKTLVSNNTITGFVDTTTAIRPTSTWNPYYNEPGGLYGIVSKTKESIIIDNNSISNLNSYNERLHHGHGALGGIVLFGSDVKAAKITNNNINNIIGLATVEPYTVVGIGTHQNVYSSIVPDSFVVSGNFIHNLVNSSTNSEARTIGINALYASRYINNNVIVLDSVPNPHYVFGISRGLIGSIYETNFLHIEHNTIHIDAGEQSINTACVHNFLNVRNNILSNLTTQPDDLKRHFAIYAQNLNKAEIQPINNLYNVATLGGRVIRAQDGNIDDIATLTANYPTDAHSIIADPAFVDVNGETAQDFISTNTVISVSLPKVSQDFEGTTRTSFYMGAFEATSSTPLNHTDLEFTLFVNDFSETEINWSINDQKSIQSYTVLSSDDASLWNEVETINVQNQSNYSALDKKTLNGKRFYQIRINNINGKTQYSPIKWVENNRSNNITLYPNPNDGQFRINTYNQKVNALEVYNMAGQLIKTISQYQDNNLIDMTSLPQGLYIIKVNMEKEQAIIQFNKN